MSSFAGGRNIQTERILTIKKVVESGTWPNCTGLSELLGVSPRTIQRDITFMRDRYGMPIEYNESMRGYEMTEEANSLLEVDVQVEDLAAMFLLKNLVGDLKGTKFGDALSVSLERLTKKLDGELSMNWSDLERVVSVQECGVPQIDLTLLGQLEESVISRYEVAFRYRKGGARESSMRKLQPYQVKLFKGVWYVVGYDVDRAAARTFALHRMLGLQVSQQTFDRPEGFSVDEYFEGSIGMWGHGGAEEVEVVLELTGWPAWIVQERPVYHGQEVKRLDDFGERIELRMKLRNLEDVKPLVLSWGQLVKVIAPDELRDFVVAEATAVLGR